MPKVVGIRFEKTPKTYYFDAGNDIFKIGDGVVVETARGVEYGFVSMLPKEISNDEVVAPLKPIIRVATPKDDAQYKKVTAKRPEALRITMEKVAHSGLDMKVVDVGYTFDGSKLIVYFTADGRVDFRELVRELASAYKVRIELRQIGARDECKMLGGIGPCGRACCCKDHMMDYARVSIKMAKNQNLSLNPGKISGICGNLMCCLSYENEYYAEVNKRMPKIGAEVGLPDGSKGIVTVINQLKESVTVKCDGKEDTYTFNEFPLSEIRFKKKRDKTEEEKEDE